jgi:hypothetical protein
MVKATKNGPVALCRCSKSASFPMCSGGCSKGCSKGCGDKVGPLVITSKSPAAAAKEVCDLLPIESCINVLDFVASAKRKLVLTGERPRLYMHPFL